MFKSIKWMCIRTGCSGVTRGSWVGAQGNYSWGKSSWGKFFLGEILLGENSSWGKFFLGEILQNPGDFFLQNKVLNFC